MEKAKPVSKLDLTNNMYKLIEALKDIAGINS